MEPDSSVVPKPGICPSCTEWPYSWTITSASSASSTPPLPRVMLALVSLKNELSPPNWSMRSSIWRWFTRGQRRAEAEVLQVRLGRVDPVVPDDLLELVV